MLACIKRNMKGLTAKGKRPAEPVRLTAELDPKAKGDAQPSTRAQPKKNRWATEAAQRCKKDSWWRLLHKR